MNICYLQYLYAFSLSNSCLSVFSCENKLHLAVDKIEYDVDLDFLKPKKEPVPSKVEPVKPVSEVPTVDRKLKPGKSAPVVKGAVSVGQPLDRRDNMAQKRQITAQVTSKPTSVAIPTVPDRSAKPQSNYGDANQHTDSIYKSLQGETARKAAELKELQQLISTKQEEYNNFQKDNERLVAEQRARQARLESDLKSLEDIQTLKDKKLKETADIMRQKRKMEEELRDMETEKKARNIEEKKR